MKKLKLTEEVELEVGGGVFRVAPGDNTYGALCVDFVVRDKNGNEFAVPIVTIESPTASVKTTPATRADAVTVYAYGNPCSDEYTNRVTIPRDDIYAVAADEGVLIDKVEVVA